MEEADALASRAGIMSRRMLAMGTTDSLRHRFGDFYHVHLVTTTAPHTPAREMERIRAWVMEYIPHATIEEKTYHGQMRFAVPAHSQPSPPQVTSAGAMDEIFSAAAEKNTSRKGNISSLFTLLEANKECPSEISDRTGNGYGEMHNEDISINPLNRSIRVHTHDCDEVKK